MSLIRIRPKIARVGLGSVRKPVTERLGYQPQDVSPGFQEAGPPTTAANAVRLMVFGQSLGLPAVVALVVAVTYQAAAIGSDAAAVDYQQSIKPILQERCFSCHGGLQQQAELRVDTVELMAEGGDSGPIFFAGEPDASLLIERISDPDPGYRMPPEGEPLTADQIDRIRAWIAAGAVAPEDEQPEPDPRSHWAFQPIRRPQVPSPPASGPGGADWGFNPIDAFIAAERARHGLTAQAAAERPLLVKRLYLDLIGLPPDPASLDRLVDQIASPAGYDRLVEQLLDDPRHGERWARHWMDIWRYSDWWGLGSQLRNSQQHIWHWRDWIVESLNQDTPYDEMVRLMLAADEITPLDHDRLRATGYLARNFFLFNRHQWMDETVEHVGKSFLGLTFNCAKCHDHKYDPLSHDDYYQLRAFFEPYHVRLDMVPGQTDFDRNAIPRVFDALPDEPTYRFIRGEETQPDKSRVIPPAVPEVLSFDELSIEPVDLPAEAWQPERRRVVQQAHLQSADQAVERAAVAVEQARQRLADDRQKLTELMSGQTEPVETAVVDEAFKPLVDDLAELDPSRWKLIGGDWSHQPGRLEQRKDGPTRAALRWLGDTSEDFEISVRFTILGGSKWRSVGIGFDETQADVTQTPQPQDQEQFVYVSAVDGGSKIQASYRQGGNSVYPADAARRLPIELEREYVLTLRVRDTLVNASLDDQPMIAWRSPLPRRPGALQITTFDAVAAIHQIKLAPLAADVELTEPAAAVVSDPTTTDQAEQNIRLAEADLRLAESTLAAAEAERDSLRLRIDALRLAWQVADSTAADIGEADETTEDLQRLERQAAAAAVMAERQAGLAQASRAVAEIETRRLRTPSDKIEAVDKELASARDQFAKAESLAAAEVTADDGYSAVRGAKWSATRFGSSGADDPQLEFPARSSGRRLALAEWITDDRNPLTARVAVNHIWNRHMGRPLVPTVFDFGRQGARPTHPDLLDWLASELIDSGWSMKHIHRLIVSSATYRMSSSDLGREHEQAVDGENLYWWRRSASRLESQVIRDTILALAGELDSSAGGPPVPPAEQTESARRSLYFFHSNNERNLFLTMFDEATVNECYRRQESIVPQQALALTNSRLVLDAIEPIAERISRVVGDDVAADPTFVRLAFQTLLGFVPDDDELSASTVALEAWRAEPETPAARARAYFVWALLNHNDFVTVR